MSHGNICGYISILDTSEENGSDGTNNAADSDNAIGILLIYW